jgi:uncharacterized membrane protein
MTSMPWHLSSTRAYGRVDGPIGRNERSRIMSTATDTIVVDVPVSTAYTQWSKPESYPQFMTGVESVFTIDDTHQHWHMSLAGVQRDFDVEVTDQQHDDHIAWQSVGELKQSGRVDFAPLGDAKTQITLSLDWEPTGMTESVGSALQLDDALVRRDLMRFKELIEEGDTPPGANEYTTPAAF